MTSEGPGGAGTTFAEAGTIFADAGADGFLHAIDLDGGAELGWHPDEPVVAASVFKVPILVELCRQISSGRLQGEARIRVTAAEHVIGPTGLSALSDDVELSLRDLATLMIAVSDNTATDKVLELVGLDAVDATLCELGLTATVLVENCRDLIDDAVRQMGGLTTADVNPEVLSKLRVLDPARTNRTTARECTTLLKRIWQDETFAEARRIMGLQIWPHRLRSGFPDTVRISGKTGTLPGVRNEIGVIEYPDGGRYAVAVFTKAHSWHNPQPAIDASIGAAARTVIDRLRSGLVPADEKSF